MKDRHVQPATSPLRISKAAWNAMAPDVGRHGYVKFDQKVFESYLEILWSDRPLRSVHRQRRKGSAVRPLYRRLRAWNGPDSDGLRDLLGKYLAGLSTADLGAWDGRIRRPVRLKAPLDTASVRDIFTTLKPYLWWYHAMRQAIDDQVRRRRMRLMKESQPPPRRRPVRRPS